MKSTAIALLVGLLAASAAAQDLVQQTFLQVHRARRDFRPGSALRPWLYTIAANLRRESRRRAARRPELPLAEQTSREPSVGPAASTPAERLVRRALQDLPDGQREVVVLHWYEGYTFREIAQIVGASQSAVKVRAHRAYERLRAVLGAEAKPSSPAGISIP